MTKTMNQQPAIEYLSISQISLNPNNPRKRMDEATLSDLAKSIEQVGVLQPVMVRKRAEDKPKSRFKPNTAYELISGHRRLLASTIAGLETIPAIIKDLTDEQAFEVAIMENLQREDVDPLDEAAAFNAMMDSGRYTVEDIATKVGKSTVFVHQRMKLSALLPELQTQLAEGNLSLTNAMAIAKLREQDQREIHRTNNYRQTTANLKQIIERDIFNKLDSATFSLTDAELVPGAGPCSTCAKRTAASPTLFPDIEPTADRCLDRSCFASKTEAGLYKACRTAIAEGRADLIAYDWRSKEKAKKLAGEGLRTVSDWDLNRLGETLPEGVFAYNALFMDDQTIRPIAITKAELKDAAGEPITWHTVSVTQEVEKTDKGYLEAKIQSLQRKMVSIMDDAQTQIHILRVKLLNDKATDLINGWSREDTRLATALVLLEGGVTNEVLNALCQEVGVDLENDSDVELYARLKRSPDTVTKFLSPLFAGYLGDNCTTTWGNNPDKESKGFMGKTIADILFSANDLIPERNNIGKAIEAKAQEQVQTIMNEIEATKQKLEELNSAEVTA